MIRDDGSYELAGVVHLMRPVGEEARDLEELRLAIARVPPRSIFHHTASRLMRHPFSTELPSDDFSAWLAGVVQDRETAERLAYVVQSTSANVEELRGALLARLDAVPEKLRRAHDAPPGGEFVFITVESVPLPTGQRAFDVPELVTSLANAEASVWFHHLIEEPVFLAADETLGGWLREHGDARLADVLESGVRSGRPLVEVRKKVLQGWRMRGLGTRVAAAARSTENERSEAGRAVVTRLARRIRGGGGAR